MHPDFTSSSIIAAPSMPHLVRPPDRPPARLFEGLKWNFLLSVAKFNEDIDGYRRRYGKAIGEAKFFLEHQPFEVQQRRGNMLMIAGASLLWECLIGNGTATSGNALTFMNTSNAKVAVGDGGPTSLTGTASVSNGSTAVTTSSSQTGLVGNYLTFTGDSTGGVYKVASGSGTSWTLATAYGGTTNGTASFASIVGEVDTQTDLQATSNKTRNAADASFPYHLTSGGDNAVTAATNATPIVVTCTNSYSNGDFVYIQGVLGNTAANGLWQISSVSGTGFTLDNSVGNGAYTSGGVASKRKVMVVQSTFGTGSANHPWNEWGLANASSGGSMLNRKVAALGTKTSAASWAFKAACALA